MKHVFIVNPRAGKGKGASKMIPKIKMACLKNGIDFEIYMTKAAGDGERHAREVASKGEPVRVYSCGGDGTLYEVVNGVVGFENAEVAVIPMGSGNDFIRLFGTYEQFSDVDAVLNGKTVTLDAIDCNGRIAINQCSMGFDANVCDKQAEFKKIPWLKGESAYVASLLYCFISMKGNDFTITLDDDEPKTMNVLFCFVGNSRWYGGGFMAAPLAMPDDGLLDVVVVQKDIPKIKFLGLIGPYKNGKHLSWGRTYFKRAKTVRVKSAKKEVVNVDGEIQYTDEAVMKIREKAIRFVVPATSSYFDDVASGKISADRPLN